MKRALLLALPLALCFGCGDDDSSAGQMSAPAGVASQSEPPGNAARAGTKIVLRDSDYGRILFNADDQAIYLFDREDTRRPRCYGDCAAAWPPVYAKGEPRLGRGLDPEKLGTVRRRDDRKQVTYGGHPLYYYAHEGPGQVLCHDVEEYGGLWLVVKRSGIPVPSAS